MIFLIFQLIMFIRIEMVKKYVYSIVVTKTQFHNSYMYIKK